MDVTRFDRLCRALEAAFSRRGVVQLMTAALTSPAWALPALRDSEAKKNKKKKRKKKKQKRKKKGGGAFFCGDPGLDGEESSFLTLINNWRATNGVAPLAYQAQLTAAADFHSGDMATDNYFDHTSPGGVDFAQNIRNHCYTGGGMGENIAAGTETANAAFTGWQASPGHNANMLNAAFTEIGIGRAYNGGSTYGWYWTTTFGSR